MISRVQSEIRLWLFYWPDLFIAPVITTFIAALLFLAWAFGWKAAVAWYLIVLFDRFSRE